MTQTAPAAAIVYPPPRGQRVDELLADVASWMKALGYQLAGAVQVNAPMPGRHRANMTLRDLSSGTLIRISEDRGRGARGCHLDHASFTSAVELTARSLEVGADLLIINKFGRSEVEGGGYRYSIERAMEYDIPVLVAVRLEHEPALRAYAGAMFEALPLDITQVRTWCLRAVGAKGAAWPLQEFERGLLSGIVRPRVHTPMTERALTSRRTLLAAVLGQVIAPFVLESGHAAMAGESVASPRQLVPISAGYPVGEIFVSLEERRLYYVHAQARAISYPIATPRDQSLWQGTQKVTAKREWPSWRPTAEMLEENPRLPRFVPGRHRYNPMGARALYLGHTYYRIHGTDAPWLIGQNVSKGCIRMLNDDVIELYESTPLGAKVTVMRQAMLVFPGKASQDDRSRSRQQGSGT